MSNFEMFQGEELIVTTDLTNIGSSKEDQTITLEIDGTQVDSQDVSVAAPSNGTEREQITLRWQSGDDESTGTKTVKVSSEDDTDTHDIGIVDISEAQFTVSVSSTNSPVQEGNTLTIDVDVTNSGKKVNAEPITLSIDNGIGQVDNSDPVTVVPGNTKTITLEWQTSTGDAMSSDYTATVESVDDTATTTVNITDQPVAPANAVFVADDDGLVASYDATDGTKKWVDTASGQTRAAHVSSDGDSVHAEKAVSGPTYSIRSLESDLGTVDFDVGTISDTLASAWSSPDSTKIYAAEEDGPLYQLDASDGSVNWSVSVGGDITEAVPGPDGDTVYVGNDNGSIEAIDVATQTTKWTDGGSSGIVSVSPSLDGESVYVCSNNQSNPQLRKLDINSAEDDVTVDWQFNTTYSMRAVCITPDGSEVAALERFNPKIYVFDASDGTQLDSTSINGTNVTEIFVDESNIYATSEARVIAVDRDTLDIEWKESPGSNIIVGLSARPNYVKPPVGKNP